MRRLFAVDGLACAGCARGLERRLAVAPGVRTARVHYLTASALLDWTEETSPEALAEAVKKAGYRLVDRHRPDEVEAMLAAQGRKLGTRLAVAVASGMWSGALALVLYLGGLPPQAAWWVALAAGAFALPVVFYSGAGFLWMAWRSLKLGDPGMDLIVAAGSLAATALSAWALAVGRANVWFDTAVMLVSLLLAARLIDVMTRRSALKALRAMAEAAPEAAQRLTPQGPRRTAAAEIAVGDRVIVDAGETAAVDGVVVVGESLLNRALLTGEPVPLAVAPGARVEAGVVNLSARLEIEVDRAFGDREIDHMGGAVALEIAQGGAEGGPAEAWAARLVRLIPLAAGLTILVGLALGRGIEMSLIQGLSLMVGVCPCALAIALPLVRLRTARLAAAAGARIREPAAFEALAHLRRIVFDKTGTLTEGTPQVVAVEPAPGVPEAALLTAAARAETGILHPIARAVTAHAGEIGPGGTRFDRGAEARDGQGALIRAETGRPGADGRARIRISRDGVELGQIVLADRLRPEAGAVLDQLRAEGLALEIATGDSAAPARALGAGLGFDAGDIHAGLTPRDKAALLRAGPRPVAFIGDGVNDGPALAAADCGLSIAAAHPAARQTAGVVIERGGIERLPGLVALSRRAAAIGRQNLTLAIAYNLCAIPAALAGLMRPEISAIAMAASSISILLNTLRLSGGDVAPPQAGPR